MGQPCPARCPACADTRHVCENHPTKRWGPLCCRPGEDGPCDHGGCGCGAGMPCPECCHPAPPQGAGGSILGCFYPPAERAIGDCHA